MAYRAAIGQRAYVFADLKALLAKATPIRSGDQLAGIAAASLEEMMAARIALADVPCPTSCRTSSCPTTRTR